MRQVELDHGSGSNEPFVMKQPERKETPPSSTAPSLIQLQLKTLVVLLAMALGIGRYLVPLQHQRHSGTAVVSPAESTETGQPQDKAEPTMISWVRHTRPFSDPVKVVLSPNWYWADVKCAAKQEMAPSSLDTVSPGDIWLLHPRQGRLPMTKQCIDAEQEDHDDLSSTLIVIFVNNAGM
ncbi:hypothetical protein BCR43DRAFT_489697 [Syncephalastrum racemosum]|uniref:Uncharacterized protein n=1 Tax=Syncephalastrum racemosum TaxID=13706 RepID=A0A1X2HEK5_SYNRA|nr:hypothetical protein BCR43DRAFT_489697 [Syncephalastrum racemosum]